MKKGGMIVCHCPNDYKQKIKEIEINFIYYVLWEKLKESES